MPDEALESFDEAVRLLVPPPHEPDDRRFLADILDRKGQVLLDLGRTNEAVEVAQQCLAIWESEHEQGAADDRQLAIAQDHLGVKLRAQHNVTEALALHERAVGLLRAGLQDHPEYLKALQHSIALRNSARAEADGLVKQGEIYEDYLRRLLARLTTEATAESALRLSAPDNDGRCDVLVCRVAHQGNAYASALEAVLDRIGATSRAAATVEEAVRTSCWGSPSTRPRILVLCVTQRISAANRKELTLLSELLDRARSSGCMVVTVTGVGLADLGPDVSARIGEPSVSIELDATEGSLSRVARRMRSLLQFNAAPSGGVASAKPNVIDDLRRQLFDDRMCTLDKEGRLGVSDVLAQLPAELVDDWREHYWLGISMLRSRDLIGAQRALAQTLASVPLAQLGSCLLALSTAQQAVNNLTDALASLRAASRTLDAVEAYERLANLLARRWGWFTDGLSALDSALELDPDDAHLLLIRAVLTWRLGRLDEADEAYRSACRLQPIYVEPSVRSLVYGSRRAEVRTRRRPFRMRDWSPEMRFPELVQPQVVEPPADGLLRVGVVLAGGGGKGAYQAGLLQELARSKRLRVVASSGASIGALNAAAFASVGPDATAAMWRQVSPGTVLRPSWRSALLVPAYLVIGLMYFIELATYNLVPLLVVALAFFSVHWALAIGLVVGLPWLILRRIGLWGRIDGAIMRMQAAMLARFSASASAGVEKLLDAKLLREWNPQIPVYCTVADYRRAFNPDSPNFHTFFVFGHCSELSGESSGTIGFYPRYTDLSRVAPSEVRDLLLRSTALPVVFPVCSRQSAYFSVDGGVLDNLPVLPMIEHGVDVILVIALRRPARLTLDRSRLRTAYRREKLLSTPIQDLFDTWEHWARRASLMRLRDEYFITGQHFSLEPMRRNIRDRRIIHRRHVPQRFGEPLFQPPRMPDPPPILVWEPEARLGGLVRGTLNFRPKNIERLMSAGASEAATVESELLALRGAAFEPTYPPVGRRQKSLAALSRLVVGVFRFFSPRQYVGFG